KNQRAARHARAEIAVHPPGDMLRAFRDQIRGAVEGNACLRRRDLRMGFVSGSGSSNNHAPSLVRKSYRSGYPCRDQHRPLGNRLALERWFFSPQNEETAPACGGKMTKNNKNRKNIPEPLAPSDRAILRELQRNGRATNAELAAVA